MKNSYNFPCSVNADTNKLSKKTRCFSIGPHNKAMHGLWWERTNWQCAWSFFWRWYALLILFYSINALQCQALKVYSNMCCSHTSSVLCMQSTQQLKVHIRIVALVIANAWDIAPAYHSFSFNVLANYAHAALQDKRRGHIRSTFIKSMQQFSWQFDSS